MLRATQKDSFVSARTLCLGPRYQIHYGKNILSGLEDRMIVEKRLGKQT